MNILQIVTLLMPEIVLSAFALGALMMDLFLFQKTSVEKRHDFLGQGILIGLMAVFFLYVFQLRWNHIYILGDGAFVASRLNTLFKLVVVGLTGIVLFIGLKTPYSSHVGEYYSLMVFSLLGMVFLISSEDLLMIFVGLEFISLTLYVLTAFQKGARRSVEGGLKYFIFGSLSAGFLLFGLSYIYGATGSTGFKEIAAMLTPERLPKVPMKMLNMGILFTLVGLGFKIAAVPFHLWAPDAYQGAPTPVTAMIATGSKVASFVALTKLLLGGLLSVAGSILVTPHGQTGWTLIVAVIAVLSMTLGNLAAIIQRNVKRLLAYSSISHAGYILVAMVATDASGVPAAFAIPSIYFYIIIYALTNVGAFGVVNAIASKTGGDDFEHFTGMARRAPFLSLLMLIFMLSLAGIPPLAGFFGKFYLFAAALQADSQRLSLLWLVAFAIAMSAVSLYYYLKLMKQMYVMPSTDCSQVSSSREMRVVLGLVGLAVVLLGIFPSNIAGFFQDWNTHPDPVWQAPAAASQPSPTVPPAESQPQAGKS